MRIIIALIISASLISCKTTKVMETFQNGNIVHKYREKNDGVKHGKFREYWVGTKITEGEFRNGKREGQWTLYYMGKDLVVKGRYAGGKKEGEWKFYRNGKEFYSVIMKSDSIVNTDEIGVNSDGSRNGYIVEPPPVFATDVTGYVQSQVIYPAAAKKAGASGIIEVAFMINKFGEVTQVRTVNNTSGNKELEKEAERVIREMPRWYPGFHREKPFSMTMTVPVKFELK